MTIDTSVGLEVIRGPRRFGERMRLGLAACWVETTNAGGAVGFPWPPVTMDDVLGEVDGLIARIDLGNTLLLVATEGSRVVGWVSLDLNESPLVAHWATVRRLQTHPAVRGRGIGSALMTELVGVAREDGLRQLRLAVRGGMGLEDFYQKLGWRVIGTWTEALRLNEHDYRDEVLMGLSL